MKRHDFAVLLGLSLILNGCSAAPSVSSTGITVSQEEATLIQLGDDQILINGQPAGETGAVQLSHDIVYYEAGQEVDYVEGIKADEYSAEEEAGHKVINISRTGN